MDLTGPDGSPIPILLPYAPILRWEDYGNGGPIGGLWNAVATIWELCLQNPSHGMRHRRHRHHSAFHVKVMDLFHFPHGFHRLSFPKSLAASAFTWWRPMFFRVTKNFNGQRLRHATRFSEPGLCHYFGAQDTVLQRHNWGCRCVGFLEAFVYGHPSHNESPNIMCMYHIIYIIIYIPIDELMTIPQYGKRIQLLTTAHLIHMIWYLQLMVQEGSGRLWKKKLFQLPTNTRSAMRPSAWTVTLGH